jgi:hypothetical protein
MSDQQYPYSGDDETYPQMSGTGGYQVPEGGYPKSVGGGGGRRTGIVAGLTVLVLLLGGGGAWYFGHRSKEPTQPIAVITTAVPIEPSPEEPATTEAAATEPTEEATTTAPTEESAPVDDALDQLEQTSRQDLTQVSLNGQYVAQLASKYPGIVDQQQETATGSHTFQAADILAEYERLRDDPANGQAQVVLLRSIDYGIRQRYQGHALYVTFALDDFGSSQSVRSWCVKRFPSLSDAAREDQCAVRRLKPPQ